VIAGWKPPVLPRAMAELQLAIGRADGS
jgi:hypothetical protein